MMDTLRITSPSELDQIPPGPVARLDARSWALTQPSEHIAIVVDGQTVARASIWANDGPAWPDDGALLVGRIGHLAIHSHGDAVIADALDRLRESGCGAVVAPMDGSTWHSYRVVIRDAPQGGPSEHPFAMEPFTGVQVCTALKGACFEQVARYVSARVPEIPDESVAWQEQQDRLRGLGITIRPVDSDHVEADLAAIYRLALAAFADNAFYTPSPEEPFFEMYGVLLQKADPTLILLAERSDILVGVGFALPDLEQKARREHVDTVIVKTIAVAPSSRGVGLGSALTLGLHENARALGLTRAIHALMHESNMSVRISRHTAHPMRRYALLGRAL